MAVDVNCDECRTTFRVKDELLGKKVRCKGCGAAVRVADAASEPDVPTRRPKSSATRKKSSSGASKGLIFGGAAVAVGLMLLVGVGLAFGVIGPRNSSEAPSTVNNGPEAAPSKLQVEQQAPPVAPETQSDADQALALAQAKKPSKGSAAGQPAAAKPGAKPMAAVALAAGAKDWPYFRGPTGMGTSEGKGLPDTWGMDSNVAWKVPMPGPGASSPIVFGDRIYITCYTGFFVPGESGGSQEDLKRHLMALRRTDGSLIWDTAIAAKLPEESKIRDHGFAASTAAADADHVYVFYGKTGVFAFDHQGKQVWEADVGSKTHGWGSSASPYLYKDLVIINASVESESLVALDRKTGKERWKAGRIREAWNTPVVVKAPSGRDELVVATQGKILAFNPETGDPLWNCNTDIGWYMVPSVVAADGIVYALGGRSGVAALAIKAGGSGDVTSSHRLWTSTKGSNVSSPVVLDGNLYWVHESKGIAYCAKGDTGEILYEKPLERAGQFYSSALLANGKLYYCTREGKTFVVAAKPQFEQLAVNDLRDRSIFNGSPAVDGARLLIRSDKFLYCIGK